MALIYSATGSLDGYIADADDRFDFAEPDEELHGFVNDVVRRIDTMLIGRRSYDLMDYWDTVDLDGDAAAVEKDFARIWRATDKVVHSTTLDRVTRPRTRLERTFDPAAVAALKDRADVLIGGPGLAAEGFRAGLVDEVWTFLVPAVIGSGRPMFAADLRLSLDLIEQRRFGNGAVGLHYRVRR